MRRRILLTLWFFGILFPLAWVGRFSQTYHQIFNQIFEPEWMHIGMHIFLYAGLSFLIVFALGLQCNRQSFYRIIFLIFFIGIFQESIQLISQGHWPVFHQALEFAFFDLIVDILGGVTGFMLAAILQRNKQNLLLGTTKKRS